MSMKVEPPWLQGCALPENKSENACNARHRIAMQREPLQRNATHRIASQREPFLSPRRNAAHAQTTLQQSTARNERIRSRSHARHARTRECLQELPTVHEREEEADCENDHRPSPALRSAARAQPTAARHASVSKRLRV